MVFLVGVAAALILGLGYVLQQRVAATAPLSELLTFRLLLDLMHRPLWWVGIGCMIVGQLLAGLALQLATVAVVEPLLSTNLLFALGFAALFSAHRVRWYEVSGAILLSAALGVFIAVGDPHSSAAASPNDAIVVLAVAAVAVVVVTLVVVGKRRSLVGESVLLATGAGLLYGLQDASTRATLLVGDRHGITSVFLNLWIYVVIATGISGILLSQSAFKAARLDYSLPPIAAAEPIAGIALGVSLLGDELSVSVLGLAIESVCLVAMVAGVVLIGRSPSLANHPDAISPAPAAHADPP
jgi:drug/metabolite transporter (DMT)-like permease